MYEYKALIVNVIDGDTVDVIVDLGFEVTRKLRLRLLGIDTPETRTRNAAEKEHGLAAKERVKELIGGRYIKIRSEKTGKYGRYLAAIELSDGRDLATILRDEGFAKRDVY